MQLQYWVNLVQYLLIWGSEFLPLNLHGIKQNSAEWKIWAHHGCAGIQGSHGYMAPEILAEEAQWQPVAAGGRVATEYMALTKIPAIIHGRQISDVYS